MELLLVFLAFNGGRRSQLQQVMSHAECPSCTLLLLLLLLIGRAWTVNSIKPQIGFRPSGAARAVSWSIDYDLRPRSERSAQWLVGESTAE